MAVITTRRFRLVAAFVLLLAPALSACSVNFGAQTDQPYNPTRGVNDRSGTVYVLHALVVSAQEGSGTVVATLVNTDREREDQLVSVSVADTPATLADSAGPQDTRIPPSGSISLGESGMVTASSDAIKPGYFVDITFTFRRAETITVQAPVVEHSGEFADVPVQEAG